MAIAETAIFIIGPEILLLWFLAVMSLFAIKYSKFKRFNFHQKYFIRINNALSYPYNYIVLLMNAVFSHLQIAMKNRFSLFRPLHIITLLLLLGSCKTVTATKFSKPNRVAVKPKVKAIKFMTGADNLHDHFELFQDKRVGIVTNQTGLVTYESFVKTGNDGALNSQKLQVRTVHLVDYITEKTPLNLVKIFAPEHGFRGTADAGELVDDSKDAKTGLPILSLYGNNKKPSPEQLKGIDVLIFDLQDVGARFYTYISHLHYVMEACAENNIALVLLDRPNPNGGIVDGPTLNPEFSSFVGMHPIPVLHGMTIGEYALMINGQGWLKDAVQCNLSIIPCESYRRTMPYDLPINPSPNLPNAQSINLYASLCLFEGTNISMGRGTSTQFQIYGSPNLPKTDFSFTPQPNLGAKNPLYNGLICYGEDLTQVEKVDRLELKWLLKAYNESRDQSKFFNSFFTKLAGGLVLQNQIEAGFSEETIRASWQEDLDAFKKMRSDYLLYP